MDITLATRPVGADDGPRFCRLWDRLSPDTVHRRFHAPLHDPPPGAQRLIEVDHDGIRREGAILDRGRFDQVAGRLRGEYGWR